jgi:RNA polymerase sigma-70 factor (ECF subfamily)
MTRPNRVERERLLRGAVLTGDQTAWRLWYEESYEPLYRYVHWRCGGLDDLADDVVQETWLTAVRRVRRFDPRQAAFGTWLRGIAANVLRNRFRRRAAQRVRTEPLESDPPGEGSAEAGLMGRERQERIATALADLPEHYEAVLRAKYVENAPVAEIAEASGQTPKAVESLLTRARQAFRTKYLALESDGTVPTHNEGGPSTD